MLRVQIPVPAEPVLLGGEADWEQMLAGDTHYGGQGSRERVGGTMEARGGLTDKWRFEPRFQGVKWGGQGPAWEAEGKAAAGVF